MKRGFRRPQASGDCRARRLLRARKRTSLRRCVDRRLRPRIRRRSRPGMAAIDRTRSHGTGQVNVSWGRTARPMRIAPAVRHESAVDWWQRLCALGQGCCRHDLAENDKDCSDERFADWHDFPFESWAGARRQPLAPGLLLFQTDLVRFFGRTISIMAARSIALSSRFLRRGRRWGAVLLEPVRRR